jgi:nucleoside-diphosphate-sugar epimerase
MSRKKVLIIGSGGFIGGAVKSLLSNDFQVYGAHSSPGSYSEKDSIYIDLLKPATIEEALRKIQPQVIINCSGIVENSEKAMLNPVFSENLLKEVVKAKLRPERIIISGSAAEYGVVDKSNIPVSEDAPLNANAGYGLSKLQETRLALKIGQEHDLPVVIARIFNPIGKGMHSRFLIPKIILQVQEFADGKREVIEVSRLDSKRDYINVEDVALAIKALAKSPPKKLSHDVYNIGSGKSTSNGELIELVIKNSSVKKQPKVIETSQDEEPLVAIQADISRLKNEFGWSPIKSIDETVREIVNGTR